MAPRYSFVEHLARSVFFSRYSERALMAMFTAYSGYFDASGHPNQQTVLTVAGFVSTVRKWSRFDVEWNSILNAEGISCFHMTDFVSSKREFSVGWEGATDKRRVFIERLAHCLMRNVNKSFRATLILSDYEAINKLFALEELLGRPYAFCCMLCSFTIRQWAKRKKAERKLLYYFEDGDKDKGNFEQMHKSAYKVNPHFLDKSEAVAFQAADFAGWKIRSSIQTAIKDDHTLDKGVRLLQSVQILKKIPTDAGVLNYEALMKYCIAHKIPRR